jgi:hypothetical protein
MRPAQEGEPGKVRNCGHERSQTLQSLFAICAHRGLGWSTLHRVAIVIFSPLERNLADLPRLGAQTVSFFPQSAASTRQVFPAWARSFQMSLRLRRITVRFCHHGRAIFHMFRSNLCETDLSK